MKRTGGNLCASVTVGLIVLAAGLIVAQPVVAQGTTAEFLWTRQFGTSAFNGVTAVALDGSGVYVAGETGGALPGQVNAGDQDAFLRKYDGNGNELWTRQFGTSASDTGWGVAADASGVYVVGDTGGTLPGQVSAGGEDAFVRKYDTNGNEVWTRQFGSTLVGGCPVECDRARAVALDTSDVYVVGESGGTLPGQANAGSFDVFIRKYDKNGNELWTRQFGSSGSDRGWGVAVDGSAVYVAGEAGSAMPGQVTAGDTDPFIRKYDSNGNEVWTRQFGSSAAEEAWALAVDSSGVFLAGRTEGTLPGQASAGGADAFLRSYDVDGTALWTRQFGTSNADDSRGLAVNASGVFVAGRTSGILPGQVRVGGIDTFARRYGPSGTEVWTRQFGTSADDTAYALGVDASGVYVAGYTAGTFAGQSSAGGTDAFVARLAETQVQPPVPVSPLGLQIVVTLAIVAAVAILFVFFFWRRKRKAAPAPPSGPPPPPEEALRPPPG